MNGGAGTRGSVPDPAAPQADRLTWRIRPADQADATAVMAVWLRSRRAAAPDVPVPIHADDEVQAWVAGTLLAERETWVVVGGEAGDVVAVMALDGCWIDQLYVDPARQREGIGTKLLELAVEQRPYGLDLWTFEANVGARRFYERHGFGVVVRTDGWNEEGAPDIRYRWPAPPGTGPDGAAPPTMRLATADDRVVLAEALVLAADWRPGTRLRSVDEVLAEAALAHYVNRWDGDKDAGVVATGVDGRPIGAAWWTFLPADDPGYGFVDDTIPEVSIGVVDDARGRGVGSALLEALVTEARRRSLPALSLSVEVDNPAVSLYRRLGFATVDTTDGAHTMVLDLRG